ncbi:MAG: hypothetical protein R3F43_09465 [bacterium]
MAAAAERGELLGVPDPFQPGRTLAHSALLYLAEVAPPWDARARAAVAGGLAHAEVRALAWKVADAPAAILPHLAALLTEHPALAGEAGTRSRPALRRALRGRRSRGGCPARAHPGGLRGGAGEAPAARPRREAVGRVSSAAAGALTDIGCAWGTRGVRVLHASGTVWWQRYRATPAGRHLAPRTGWYGGCSPSIHRSRKEAPMPRFTVPLAAALLTCQPGLRRHRHRLRRRPDQVLVGPGCAPAAEGTAPVEEGAPIPLVRPEAANTQIEVEDPFAIDPARYLERMVRYEVTHEVGFEAVQEGCGERMTVELYPLRDGWTVFARYSGHAREEKVDQVQLDEFVPLSQRLARALLRDQPITDTITRETVLRADSEADLRTIDGSGHFVLALGTTCGSARCPRPAAAPSARRRATSPPSACSSATAADYKAWGVDFFTRGSLGSSQAAPRQNPTGGHVDFDGSGALGLHFLRYFDAEGVTSFYLGGGAQFELALYSIIRAEEDRKDGDRERFFAGGINADLILGYEFMRASSVHFYLRARPTCPPTCSTWRWTPAAWRPGCPAACSRSAWCSDAPRPPAGDPAGRGRRPGPGAHEHLRRGPGRAGGAGRPAPPRDDRAGSPPDPPGRGGGLHRAPARRGAHRGGARPT